MTLRPSTVRPFRVGDEGRILEIMVDCLKGGELEGVRQHDLEQSVDRLRADPSLGAVSVEPDGTVAGLTIPSQNYLVVDPAFRRRGLARLIMSALEESAAAAGHTAVVLNSGGRQPEALALYAALGYTPVPGFGVYADAPGAVFLGKDLPGPDAEERSWAS
jgi:GNAT superfamily N-acetyltransferase